MNHFDPSTWPNSSLARDDVNKWNFIILYLSSLYNFVNIAWDPDLNSVEL